MAVNKNYPVAIAKAIGIILMVVGHSDALINYPVAYTFFTFLCSFSFLDISILQPKINTN